MEAELSWNLRVRNGRVEVTDLDMHALTRESQEVMVGLILVTTFPIDVLLADLYYQLISSTLDSYNITWCSFKVKGDNSSGTIDSLGLSVNYNYVWVKSKVIVAMDTTLNSCVLV